MTSQELIKKQLSTEKNLVTMESVDMIRESQAPISHRIIEEDIHSPTTKNSSIKEEFTTTYEDKSVPEFTQDSKDLR